MKKELRLQLTETEDLTEGQTFFWPDQVDRTRLTRFGDDSGSYPINSRGMPILGPVYVIVEEEGAG